MIQKKEHDRFAILKLGGLSDFRDLAEGQNVHIQDLFPLKKEMEYSKDWLHIGWIEKYNFRKRERERTEFFLDMRKVVRLFVVGMTGSGKSMLLRRIGDFAAGSGFYLVYMTDVKDEMKSSMFPQRKFASQLAKDDIPTGIKMRVFRPVFYNEYLDEKMPDDNEPFQLKYSDLSLSDLLALLNLDRPTTVDHANLISLHYNNVKSLEQLRDVIMNDSKVTNLQKTKITRRIESLIKYKVCTEEGSGDFIQALKDGFAVVFNHRGFQDVAKEEVVKIPLVFFSTVMRQIKHAKETTLDKRRRMLMVIDEAPVFLGLDTTKEEVMRAVNQWRYLGIYIAFAAQKLDMLPEWILTQCRYLIGRPDLESYIAMLKAKGKYDFHPSYKRDASDVLRSMKTKASGEREWLMIDEEETIFFNYPSISAHTEEMGA